MEKIAGTFFYIIFLLASLFPSGTATAQSKYPNIIFIITDQMSATMLSCSGNRYVNTPNLDKLASSGVRFERAYASNPLCAPSRYSIFSGDAPSQIGMLRNGHLSQVAVPQQKLDLSMGNLFKRAGYETAYGGKTHLVGRNGKHDNVELYGFENLTSDYYDELVDKSKAFIKKKHDKPFLLVASLVNPHDICYMAIQDFEGAQGKKFITTDPSGKYRLPAALEKPSGVSDEDFFSKYCPPLPANYKIPEKELTAFTADKPDFIHWTRNNWTENDWRLHRWAYARLTEMVDKQVGEILETLKESGLEENTIVIYTSDHGEQDGAHRLEEKSYLYEESVRVPFLLSWKGKIKPGQVDKIHLVSTGLDLMPTLCDMTGIRVPSSFGGQSVKPLLMETGKTKWRKYLVVENNIARLVIMDSIKYMVGRDITDPNFIIYDPYERNPAVMTAKVNSSEMIREMLIDLKPDPGEMNNLAFNKNYKKELQKGRRLLFKWYKDHGFKIEDGYRVR